MLAWKPRPARHRKWIALGLAAAFLIGCVVWPTSWGAAVNGRHFQEGSRIYHWNGLTREMSVRRHPDAASSWGCLGRWAH